jgi:hypothetical protein
VVISIQGVVIGAQGIGICVGKRGDIRCAKIVSMCCAFDWYVLRKGRDMCCAQR